MSSGGGGRLMTLAELSQAEEGTVASHRWSTKWDIPEGSAISITEPTLVHWQVSVPQGTHSFRSPRFESVREIIEFSQDRPELIFRVVTLQLVS